jgi:uncharacterized protein (TIGR02246 family)
MPTAIILLTFLVTVPIEGQDTGRNAIEQVLTDFAAAFNAKDAAKLASLYSDDAVLMPQGVSMVKGRVAVQSAISTMVARGGVVRFDPPSAVEVTGDRAVAAGTYSVTIPGQGGSAATPQVIAAKYLTVFKRVGSGWKIVYDMQNVDPAPK